MTLAVYDGRGTLEKGETAEARFIKIQAAYELLIDQEKRQMYDLDHRFNPMKVFILQFSFINLYVYPG
jgi:curved DNA-binding protein CbpA